MIFDIQSGVESRLKRLLVIVLTPLLWNAGGTEFAEHRKKLDDAVEAMLWGGKISSVSGVG
jgi:hypothetical protein